MATASLSLPEGHYLHRYLFLRISALLHRRPPQPSHLVLPEVLSELGKSGLFHRVSLYIWKENQEDPAQFHAGDAPIDVPEEALMRADWSLGGIAVSILALPAEVVNATANLHLLGFVSQQAAQLVHTDAVRFVNEALKAQIQDLREAIHARKLFDRAASLLVAHHGFSLPAAQGTCWSKPVGSIAALSSRLPRRSSSPWGLARPPGPAGIAVSALPQPQPRTPGAMAN